MTESELVLKTLREAVADLPAHLQLGVLACAEEIRIVVARYNNNNDGCGSLALGLVGAEAAAEVDE